MEPEPTKIDVEEVSLLIAWNDGHKSVYPYRDLRASCPCALCKGEVGLFGRGYFPSGPNPPEGIKPVKIRQVGRYAISIEWSDGHRTGIYPFNYLRELCQCDECKGRH